MANLKIVGALTLSAAFAMATPAMAQRGGGGGFHGGGGGGFHGGGGGFHGGGFGGGMRAGMPGGGGGFRAAAMSGGSFRNANASMGMPSNNSFAGRGAVVANGGGRNWNGGWHGGGWRRGYGPGIGFAAGLAAGSALGYGYGGYYGGGYYPDDYAYNNDGYYDSGDSGYVVSSNADPASCAARYRSYDPASGTYLGYDGLRHPCE